MQKSERKYELAVLLLITAVVSFLAYTAATDSVSFVGKGIGPMVFPQIILWIILVLCVTRLVFTLRFLVEHHNEKDESARTDPRVWVTYVLIVLYAVLWNVLGFSISTFIYFTAQAWVLNRQTVLWKAAIFGLIIAAVMSMLFGKVFYVNFPEPVMELIFG